MPKYLSYFPYNGIDPTLAEVLQEIPETIRQDQGEYERNQYLSQCVWHHDPTCQIATYHQQSRLHTIFLIITDFGVAKNYGGFHSPIRVDT